MDKMELCEECVCAPVCSIFRATGGLARCVMFRSLRTGKWVVKDHGDFLLYHCSECDNPSAKARNYCAECGAQMDEEET